MLNTNHLHRITVSSLKDIQPSTSDAVITNARGKVSELWHDIFSSRANYPDHNAIQTFRSNGSTEGVGDPKFASLESAKMMAARYSHILRLEGVSKAFVQQVEESTFGSPLTFYDPYFDVVASPSFLKNLRNAHHIANIYKQHLSSTGALDICEIGAGYGALAFILHQLLPIRSYTIIDLPKNLYLSSVYLKTLLSGVEEQGRQNLNGATKKEIWPTSTLKFVLPQDSEAITAKFDLIINIDSLGEMPLDTAQSYITWVSKQIRSGGIFHSDNRFATPEIKGTKCISDSGYNQFKLVSLAGMLTPTSLFNHMHHIGNFTSLEGSSAADSKSFDGIGELLAVGFSSSISELIASLESHTLSSQSVKFLEHVNQFFHESTADRRYANIDAMKHFTSFTPIINCFEGLLDFVSDNFESAADKLATFVSSSQTYDHAKTVALTILVVLHLEKRLPNTHQAVVSLLSNIEANALHLLPDIQELVGNRRRLFVLQNYIRRILKLESVRYRQYLIDNIKVKSVMRSLRKIRLNSEV